MANAMSFDQGGSPLLSLVKSFDWSPAALTRRPTSAKTLRPRPFDLDEQPRRPASASWQRASSASRSEVPSQAPVFSTWIASRKVQVRSPMLSMVTNPRAFMSPARSLCPAAAAWNTRPACATRQASPARLHSVEAEARAEITSRTFAAELCPTTSSSGAEPRPRPQSAGRAAPIRANLEVSSKYAPSSKAVRPKSATYRRPLSASSGGAGSKVKKHDLEKAIRNVPEKAEDLDRSSNPSLPSGAASLPHEHHFTDQFVHMTHVWATQDHAAMDRLDHRQPEAEITCMVPKTETGEHFSSDSYGSRLRTESASTHAGQYRSSGTERLDNAVAKLQSDEGTTHSTNQEDMAQHEGLVIRAKCGSEWVTADFRPLSAWQQQNRAHTSVVDKKPPRSKKPYLRGIPKITGTYRPTSVQKNPFAVDTPQEWSWPQNVLSSLRKSKSNTSADRFAELIQEVQRQVECGALSQAALDDSKENAETIQEQGPPSSRRSSLEQRASSKPNSKLSSAKPDSRAGSKSSDAAEVVDQGEVDEVKRDAVGNDVYDLDNLLERLKRDPTVDGFTDQELARYFNCFRRFWVPGSSDVHKDDIIEVLKLLGCFFLDRDDIGQLMEETTPFDYMDFEDFEKFLAKYALYCRRQYRVIFDTYDDDNSGEISVEELKTLGHNIGLMPVRSMTQEALGIVDRDGNGSLDFDELLLFLAFYRSHEGFCKADVVRMKEIFDSYCENDPPALPASNVQSALVGCFGMQAAEFADSFSEALAQGKIMRSSHCPQLTAKEAQELPKHTFKFPGFLMLCRLCQDSVYNELQPIWHSHAEAKPVHQEVGSRAGSKPGSQRGSRVSLLTSHSDLLKGGISHERLEAVLKSMKYTPLQKVMEEVYMEVIGEEEPEARLLDFDEFFDFVLTFRRRCGFSLDEISRLRELYNEMDEDQSGEISSLKLANIFRLLGYKVTTDDLNNFLLEVDSDQSGQLNFVEFQALMGLHRHDELQKIKTVFGSQAPKGYLSGRDVLLAGDALGGVVDKELIAPHHYDFDGFVGLVDESRNARVVRERRMAGYTVEQIKSLERMFCRFDSDDSGSIGTLELVQLLQDPSIKRSPKTKKDQEVLVRTIEQARQKAIEAGAKEAASSATSEIDFWTFVQLYRLLQDYEDRLQDSKLVSLSEELRFTRNEVDQFRRIFVDWAKFGDKSKTEIELSTHTIKQDVVCRIFRSAGVSLVGHHMTELENGMQPLLQKGRLGFYNFLRLMRWVVDVDFGGLGGYLKP